MGVHSDGHAQGFAHRLAAYAASSRTQALQRKTVGGGTTYLKSGSQIITLDLTGIP